MSAFEKVLSGIPMMDQALNHIRMGDNVVWPVSNLEEFKTFAVPFVHQAIRDHRNVIYVPFAEHPPILEPMNGLRITPNCFERLHHGNKHSKVYAPFVFSTPEIGSDRNTQDIPVRKTI